MDYLQSTNMASFLPLILYYPLELFKGRNSSWAEEMEGEGKKKKAKELKPFQITWPGVISILTLRIASSFTEDHFCLCFKWDLNFPLGVCFRVTRPAYSDFCLKVEKKNGTFPSQRLSRDYWHNVIWRLCSPGMEQTPCPHRLLPSTPPLRAWDVNGRLINLILISSFKEATVSVLCVCGKRATWRE